MSPGPRHLAAAEGTVLRLHGRLARSRANGPGLRAVVWLQGCTLGCRSCFNPESHDPAGGEPVAVADLVAEILSDAAALEGVTVSGGEPFQQPAALLALLTGLRGGGRLSTLVFSGYDLAQLERQPLGRACLERIDVLVAGRYVPARHRGRGLLGSSNQRIHLLTDRYGPAELADLPEAELQIDTAGRISLTGVGAPAATSLGALPEDLPKAHTQPW